MRKRRGISLAVLATSAILAAIVTAYGGNPGSAGDTTADVVLGQFDFSTVGGHSNPRQLLGPSAVAIDRSVTPNRLFIADTDNNRVLGYASVVALANGQPADIVIGQPDFISHGVNNGGLSAASLNNPQGVAVDGSGNLYVADTDNDRVLEYSTPFSNGTTAAMVIGQPGFTSNIRGASATGLAFPTSVALDNLGNLFVADRGNDRVLEFNAPAASGNTTADVVFGQHGAFNLIGCNNGGLSASSLCSPTGVAIDPGGNLYVVDNGNNRVLEYDQPLKTDTVADMVFGQGGSFTAANNNPPAADTFGNPTGAAADTAGNLYVEDTGFNRVLEYDNPASSRNTVAARVFGQSGDFTTSNSSPISAASLSGPRGAALDASGHLYVADSGDDRMLEFDTPPTSANANLVLGQTRFDAGTALADATTMLMPTGIAVDRGVTPNRLYVADFVANRVLGYHSVAALTSGAPADIVIGEPDLFTTQPNFDGVSADSLNGPSGIAVDSHGNLYVADTLNNRVLEYNSPFTTDCVADMVFGANGNFTANSNENNPSASSLLNPDGVAVDGNGTVYVADTGNNRVLGYPDPMNNGTTASIALGQSGFTGNSSNPPSAQTVAAPQGVAVDGAGSLYVADSGNGRLLIFSAPISNGQSAGLVTGTSTGDFNSPGNLQVPSAVAVAAAGTVYLLERDRNRALAYSGPTVDMAGQVFGQSGSMSSFVCNSGLTAPTADTLCESQGFVIQPRFAAGLAVDASGNVFIADALNGRALEYFRPPSPSVAAVAMVPGVIDFGNVEVTMAQARGEAVNNNQSIATTANFSVNGSSDFFAQSPTCSAPINSTCTNNIIFAPSKTGPQNAQLTVTLSGSGGGPFMISLSGNGVVATPTASATPTATPTATATAAPTPTATPAPVAASLSASPLNLSFGSQQFAVSGSSSRSKLVTMINRGRATVTLFNPSIFGNNPGDFQVSAGATNAIADVVPPACGPTLAPHQRCTVSLSFKPTSLGRRSAALVLGSNALKGAPAISLNGQGVPPRLFISPGTVPFGTQKANTTSAPQPVVLNNRSAVAIEIQEISVDTPEFAADQSCLGILNSGAQCTVAVTFTPNAAGKMGGFLSIRDNAAGFVQRIRLSGTGN